MSKRRKNKKKQNWDLPEKERQLFLEAVESLKNFQGDLIKEKFDFFEPLIKPKKKSSSHRGPGKQIKATLDLHGFSRVEAVDRLDQFCRRAAQHNLQPLMVITGKGIHSHNRKSALRQEVIRWLNSEKGRLLVESYRPGLPYQGGDGVLILYLHT